ncbi:ABC transporter AbcB-related protein [Trichomonas vaginalis G3]|uniref:ABC transporter AbcB-related protein n=1 Tax=Trichomonas vaginalis (strain ATCC PRA-98 / G3) TaxID=412133 RepID=A2G1W8_TRIV3|nr:ATPase activity, coupled to transmembrane movement of substances [Trichomonas vaginalis G3]EAX88847.1 ABC transporter AbcB-related protein [Trichomonas vaginalis G3]KAI5515534.1 ATPase activity, coupled to transmembrane movement of substances [Trichomonas vaginalis G3]|eukprot:XP_001301777.1 ABC transporter AbcB-related protein [Trichomonas vaginalis G3]
MPPRTAVFRSQGSQDGEDVKNVKTTGFEMFKTLKYFRYKTILFLTFLFSMLMGAITVVMMIYMGDLTSSFGSDPTKTIPELMTPFILKMTWWNIAQVVVMAIAMAFRSFATPTINLDLRRALFTSLMNQPIEYFDKTSAGVLVSRLSEDVTLVRETYIDKTCTVLQGLTQAVMGVIMAFVNSALVSLIILVAIPIILITFWLGETFVDS